MRPSTDPPRFGFVVHPLTPFQRRLLGVRSLDAALCMGRPSQGGPRIIARLSVADAQGARAQGILVSVPLLPEEMLDDQTAAVEQLVEAVSLCHAEGARLVGLGAVAAVIGGQGKAVARAAPCPVTTGNGMTAWAAHQTVIRLRAAGVGSGPLGLLGPPGPVANAILLQLTRDGEHVRVVSPAPPRPLQRLMSQLDAEGPGRVEAVASAEAVLEAGQLLIAASSTGGRLRASALPAGSVVVDVAEPLDVARDVAREDVLILDGEYVRLPRPLGGGLWHHVYGTVTGQGRHIFACFAEPMLFSLAGDTSQCSVGRSIPLGRLDAIADLAMSRGFWVDRLHAGGRPVSPKRLRRFSG